MAIQRGHTGIVAVGLPGSSTWSTTIAATNLLYVDGFGATNFGEFYNADSVATGWESGPGLFATSSGCRFTLTGPVTDTTVAILNAMFFGTNTKSTVDSAYQHVANPIAIGSELPYVSMYIKHVPINDTGTTAGLAIDGCILDSFTLSADAGGVWRWSGNFMGESGAGFATDLSALTKPTAPLFRFAQTQFVYSTTLPTAVTASPGYGLGTAANLGGGTGQGWTNVDWSTALKSISMTFSNNCSFIYTAGASTSDPAGITRGNRKMSITAGVHFNLGSVATIDSASYGSFHSSAGTQTSAQGVIVRCYNPSYTVGATYKSYFEYLFPTCVVTAKEMEPTLGVRGFSQTWTAFSPASLDSCYPVTLNANNLDYM